MSTFPAELQAHIRSLRAPQRGWGADTILLELRQDARWREPRLPSAARSAAFLQEAGLTRADQQRRPVAQPPVDAPTQPPAAWQLDAQGR